MVSIFLSSDESDGVDVPPLHSIVYSQLLEHTADITDSSPPGFIDHPFNLTEAQPLFIVIDVYERMMPSPICYEKVLRLWPGRGLDERFVHLRGIWSSTLVEPGDNVFVHNKWEKMSDPHNLYEDNLATVIDSSNGSLIVQPLILISSTLLAKAEKCTRQAYLDDIAPRGPQTVSMLRGSIVHELIQGVIFDHQAEVIEQRARDLATRDPLTLYLNNLTEAAMLEQILPHLAPIYAMAMEVASSTQSLSIIDEGPRPVEMLVPGVPPYGCHTLSVEEVLHCFSLGLKGRVDVALEHKGKIFSLELKSGASERSGSRSIPRSDHGIQLFSYVAMAKERFGDTAADAGLLYYAKDNKSFALSPKKREIDALLSRRNALAYALAHRDLPSTTATTHPCKYCAARDACALLEEGARIPSPIRNEILSFVGEPAGPRALSFFQKWEEAAAQEAADARAAQASLWLEPPKRREERAQAILNLTVNGPSKTILELLPSTPITVEKSGIETGMHVAITRGGYPPIAGLGRIISITPERISIELIFGEFVHGEGGMCLDKWDSPHAAALGLRNISTMLSSSTRLRKLIVEGETPLFDDISNIQLIPPPKNPNPNSICDLDSDDFPESDNTLIEKSSQAKLTPQKNSMGFDFNSIREKQGSGIVIPEGELNDDQKKAVKMTLAARDYALLLGMPGTGKTTAVAALVAAMAARGDLVLVAAYTHAAVDHLCLKLISLGVPLLRLGAEGRVDKALESRRLDAFLETGATSLEIGSLINSVRVIATTCLGAGHPLILSKKFDVCVIDEASQVALPVLLGPISRADKFVLVGDHYQLPPISGENMPSLFRTLCESHPHALVTLRTQYRMNAEILKLCNELVYDSRIRCGNSLVSTARLKIRAPEAILEFGDNFSSWIGKIINGGPVQFVDIDTAGYLEERAAGSKINLGEAAATAAVAVSLVICGVDPSEIGIISPYRSQARRIEFALRLLMYNSQSFFPGVIVSPDRYCEAIEVYTVDKFQGRDKDCILFSAVKSNRRKSPGTHISDWRRLNVAMTRAKKKLVLFGSKLTLLNSGIFHRIMEVIPSEEYVSVPSAVNEVAEAPFTAFTEAVLQNPSEEQKSMFL